MNKQTVILSVLSILLLTVGYVLLLAFAHPGVAMGVFLLQWGNSLQQAIKKD